MAKFIKDVVKPGKYVLKNGKVLNLTAGDVRHINTRVGEMVKAGLHIPVAWGHQGNTPKTREEALAAKVKNTLGHASGAKLEADGRSAFALNVPGAEDAAKLPSIKFVSPEIRNNWVDGRGRLWPGLSVTEVAVTANPVNPDQRPFESAQLSRDVFRLAMDDIDDAATGEEVTTEPPGDETPKKDDADEGKGLPGLIEALKAHGFNVPEGVNSLAKLIIAVQSNDNDCVERKDDKGGDGYKGDGISEQPPLLMSLDDSRDPRDRRILTQERDNLDRRAAKLVPGGKVDKTVADKLRLDLKRERLFLDKQGGVQGGKALAKLEAYEALPASPFFSPAQLALDSLAEVEPPPDRVGQDDDREAREDARRRAEAMSVGKGRRAGKK